VKPPACLRPPGWLRLPTVLLVMAAVTTWAVPGSATVSSARAQHLTLLMAAPTSTAAPSTSCDPTASLRPTEPPQVTAGSFMAKIRARGFLIAGVDQNTYHFGYLNPLDGKIEGFDIDMVHAVAAAIFGNPDKVEFKASSDAQRIPDVQSAAVDIVAHTMTINCARLQQGDVAAISTDDSILAGLAAQDPWTKIVGPRFSSEPYGLAISQQHPDFVRFVNAVLQQLRTNGQWAASFARWVGTPVPAPPPAHYKG
jgi:ABC-type amino acid transport substrate-binding protein